MSKQSEFSKTDWIDFAPFRQSIVKTKSSPGRWFTAVTFIMEMDGKYYHVRKDGIGNDINQIHMKCNNGVRQCKWKGVLQRYQVNSRESISFYPSRLIKIYWNQIISLILWLPIQGNKAIRSYQFFYFLLKYVYTNCLN